MIFRGFLPVLFLVFASGHLSAQSVQANERMKEGNYTGAVELFEKAVSVNNPEYADLTSLAYCYIMLHDFAKAETVYEKIMVHPKKDNTQHFFYGEVLRINGKFSKAKEQYTLYQAAFPDDFRGAQRLKSCDSIQAWNNSTTAFKVATVPAINTPYEEMSPWFSGKDFFFTSTSKELFASCGGTTTFRDPQLSFVYQSVNGKISVKKIQTKDSMSFSTYQTAFGNEILVTKKITMTSNGEEMNASQILLGRNGSYATFKPAGAPDGFTFSHPCMANGGKRLYFVSDMCGGAGGTDIYYSDSDGSNWGPAISAGNNINTPGNEMFPYVCANDSLLYFASDGHPGYGNMDIFISYAINGVWQKPANMRSPINSIGNDFSLVYSNRPWEGYLVSNRYPESKGGTDIFSFSVEKSVIVKPDTTKPFVYKADPNLLYAFFKTGSAEIDPMYAATLDSLAGLMKQYDYLNLNVSAFADERGTESVNSQLVKSRMDAISNWFVKAGVSANRIVSTPGKVSSERQLPNMAFHVQIGFVKASDQTAYFEWKTNNKYKVACLKKANGFAYFTGNGNLADMQKLASEINARYSLGAFVITTYRSIILEDTYYAPNRRAEMKLFNK